ncbi:UNVERIFIED_CONTAM: hypothetical protein RMT77_006346 [Armadillidium vulgare]
MFTKKTSVAVCLVIFLSLAEIFECQEVDNLGLEDFGSTGMKAKREPYDSNCFGPYDRKLSYQLNRVCDDCYNLFRQSYVSTECRRNCFQDEMFLLCVRGLKLDVDYYKAKVKHFARNLNSYVIVT